VRPLKLVVQHFSHTVEHRVVIPTGGHLDCVSYGIPVARVIGIHGGLVARNRTVLGAGKAIGDTRRTERGCIQYAPEMNPLYVHYCNIFGAFNPTKSVPGARFTVTEGISPAARSRKSGAKHITGCCQPSCICADTIHPFTWKLLSHAEYTIETHTVQRKAPTTQLDI